MEFLIIWTIISILIIVDRFDKVRKLEMDLYEVGEELYELKQKIKQKNRQKKIFYKI
jgi:hypothetical protein